MNTWTETENALIKTFEFNTFKDAINWMMTASEAIDTIDHHPTWTNTYNTVSVILSTHDAGNTVTDKDRQMATLLDELYRQQR